MDTSKMKYPFGRCPECGKEFNSELRNEYEINNCPWCGKKLDDIFSITDSITQKIREDDIFCESCGQRIYERHGEHREGGDWIDPKAGVCSGPCERELCGSCADWDINGECEICRNSPCGQCPNHKAIEICKQCDHLLEREKWPAMAAEKFVREKHQAENPCEHCGNNCDETVCEESAENPEHPEYDPCDSCPYHTEVACMGCLEKIR